MGSVNDSRRRCTQLPPLLTTCLSHLALNLGAEKGAGGRSRSRRVAHGVTMILPIMPGWKLQITEYVPGRVKRNR
jgi:hypothetical protein